MIKVKTFSNELKIFHTINELNQLDQKVNDFIREKRIKKVVAISDSCTTDNSGATIGLVRVLAYEETVKGKKK